MHFFYGTRAPAKKRKAPRQKDFDFITRVRRTGVAVAVPTNRATECTQTRAKYALIDRKNGKRMATAWEPAWKLAAER